MTIIVILLTICLLVITPIADEGDIARPRTLGGTGNEPIDWAPQSYIYEKPAKLGSLTSLAVDVADVNGDGLDDIIDHCSGNETYPRRRGPQNCIIMGRSDRDLENTTVVVIDNVSSSFGIGDVNADGCDEVASYPYPTYTDSNYFAQVPAPTELQIRFGGKDGPSAEPDQRITLSTVLTPSENQTLDVACADIGDVNADGFDDLVAVYRLFDVTELRHRIIDVRIQEFYGSPDGLSTSPAWDNRSQAAIGNGLYQFLQGIVHGNYNGDAYSDMLWTGVPAVWLGSADGISPEPDAFLRPPFHLGQYISAPINFDGDSIDDICLHGQESSGYSEENYISFYNGTVEGAMGQPALVKTFITVAHNPPTWTRAIMLDYDGDGLDDLVVVNTSREFSGYKTEHGLDVLLSKVDMDYFHNDGGWFRHPPKRFSYDLKFDVPYPLLVADIDGDGADDLIILRNFAGIDELPDVPSTDNLWIIYGVGDLHEEGQLRFTAGPLLYAGLRSYDFTARLWPDLAPSYDKIRLTLDPGVTDAIFALNQGPGGDMWFSPAEHACARVTSVAAIEEPIPGGFKWVRFSVLLDWDWPHEDLCDVTLEYIVNGTVVFNVTNQEVFSVENDLDLYGALAVCGGIHGPIDYGGWVRGGETLTVSGVSVVYEGTVGTHPPAGTCNVTLSDDDGGFVTQPLGGDGGFSLSIDADDRTDLDERLVLALADLPPSAEARSERAFALRVDADPPRLEDAMPDSYDWTTVSDVLAHITANDTGTSGIDADSLEYSYKGPVGVVDWSRARLIVDARRGTAEGTVDLVLPDGAGYWVRWRVRDVVGNPNETAEIPIRVDTKNVTFLNAVPREDAWQNRTSFECGITVWDLTGSGVDASSIEYRVSADNTSGYGPWTGPGPSGEDAPTIDARTTLSLPDGPFNRIQWRARDIAGNGPSVSAHYRILVDTVPVTFTGFAPVGVRNSTEVIADVTITDGHLGSGVNLASCMYRVHIDDGPLSEWEHAEARPLDGGVAVTVQLKDLAQGGGNMVQFVAIDNARNGPAISQEYTIVVDTEGPVFTAILPSEGKLNGNRTVTVTVLMVDGVSGFDEGRASYRYSVWGMEGMCPWERMTVGAVEGGHQGSVTLTFERGRQNLVQFKAYDRVGNEAVSEARSIWVNRPPIAVVTSPEQTGSYTEDEPIKLVGEESYDPDDEDITFEWFIDGSPSPISTEAIAQIRSLKGYHTIMLVVRDGFGEQDGANVTFDVRGRAKEVRPWAAWADWTLIVLIIVTVSLVAVRTNSRRTRCRPLKKNGGSKGLINRKRS